MDRIAPVHGAPCWVSLASGDLSRAQDFYADVLGWTYRPGSLGDEFCVAFCEGAPVAGIGEVARAMGMAVAWTPYFSVTDADETAGRVGERCGTVGIGPLRLGHGRTAVAADPDGARFGFWEGDVLTTWHAAGGGAPPVRVDLRTRDAFAAAIFYGELLDWASEEGPCEVEYAHDTVTVRVGDSAVATLNGGAVEAAPDPRVRPRWEVSFPVRDVDAVLTATVKAGGSVARSPEDPDTDDFGAPKAAATDAAAVLCDPEGALFTVHPRGE